MCERERERESACVCVNESVCVFGLMDIQGFECELLMYTLVGWENM